MAGRTIGDLLFGFRGDGKQLQIDAVKAGGDAGTAAGKTFSQKFATGVKTAGGAIAGGLGAALLIGTTARLRDLEAATADFRRETGATAAEATKAGQAINDMAGRNLQPIAEIGRTLTAVTVQWGLTGDAAAAAAEDVLQFARATGMDAESAVGKLDDVMDSWNLTAEDSQAIMDKLIVSHQRYGGSIVGNLDALTNLAPAMQAANLSYDDGIALLGMFADAGVDAAAAPVALQRALTKVKSPQELQRLMADIANTTDDFDRARKAADLFGARAGAKLSQALKGANIDDYAVSMEDAAGATDKAADASLTLADKVQMAFRNITGDVVKLLGENGTLLQGIAGMTTLLGPLAGAGKKMGLALGAAIGAAMGPQIASALAAALLPTGVIGIAAAAAVVAIPVALIVGKPAIDKAIHDLYAGISEVVGGGGIPLDLNDIIPSNGQATNAQWYQKLLDLSGWDPVLFDAELRKRMRMFNLSTRDALAQVSAELTDPAGNRFARLDEDALVDATLPPVPEMTMAVGSWAESLWKGAVPRMAAAQAAAWDASLAEGRAKNFARSQENAAATAGNWLDGMVGALRSGAGNVAEGLAQVVAYANERAAAEAADLIPSIKSEIRSRLDQVRDVMQDLRYAITHPWTGIREAVAIEAALSSSAMRKGLKSQDPQVRAEALDRQRFLEARLKELTTETSLRAFLASKELRRGLKSKDPEIRAEWVERRRFAKRKLDQMATDAAAGGRAQGWAYLTGFANVMSRGDAYDRWNATLQNAADRLGGSLPEAGPLVGVEKGGTSVGEAWSANLIRSLSAGRAALGRELGAVGSTLASGMGLSPMTASVVGSMAPITGESIVRHTGSVEVNLSRDTITAARQLGASWSDVGRMASAAIASPDQAIRRWEDG